MPVSENFAQSFAAGATAAAFLFLLALLATDLRAEPAFRDPQLREGFREGLREAPRDRLSVLTEPETPSLKLPTFPPQIEPGDDIAALEAIEIALTQAGDGATYVWRRGNGRLIGSVRPTSTFRDADRRMCRHIEMELRAGSHARRTEGIACRAADGVWELEG